MAEKYQIIARYTDGNADFWIGRKLNPDGPLNEENVEWKRKDGMPLRFKNYKDARNALSR